MDGKAQNFYPIKIGVLWFCGIEHPLNKKLIIDDINFKGGKYLYRLEWLKEYKICKIDYLFK